jgi:hypothetical protein
MSGKVDSFASRAMMSPNKGENEVDGEETLSRLVDAPLKRFALESYQRRNYQPVIVTK